MKRSILYTAILSLSLVTLAHSEDNQWTRATGSPHSVTSSGSSSVSSSVVSSNPIQQVQITGAPTNFNQDIKSSAVGIGLSAAANPGTCFVPIFSGLLQMQDDTCVMIKETVLLKQLEMSKAADMRMCQSATIRKAIKDAGGTICTSAYPEFPMMQSN